MNFNNRNVINKFYNVILVHDTHKSNFNIINLA